MTDLAAAVFQVQSEEPVQMPSHLGRAVHAWWLRQLEAYDAQMAAEWHNAESSKPYTCSGLVGGRAVEAGQVQITPEDGLWLRVTTLSAPLSAALLRLVQMPPAAITLDGTRLLIRSATVDSAEHPWAGSTDYEALAAVYLMGRGRPAPRVTLDFASPVTFKRDGMNLPLPLPELVFGGLGERWNAFSTVAIADRLREFCRTQVAVSRLRLRSEAVPGKNGKMEMGGLGRVTYPCLSRDRYWLGVLHLLADFAFYAGAGRSTTTGMGRTRRVMART